MLPTVHAVQLVRRMSSGRNRPALFGCENEQGVTSEYVVKLSDSLDGGTTALAFEALAALLAERLGLAVPSTAVVQVDADLAEAVELVDLPFSESLKRSIGSNIGSVYLSGRPIWGANEQIPIALRQPAIEVFAFDALIQNPDRRSNNPNVLVGSSEINPIDHEAAFSFYYAVGKPIEPWKVAELDFLSEHVFLRRLKGRQLSLERFRHTLNGLGDNELEAMMKALPTEWHTERLSVVVEHVQAVRDHAAQFVEQIEGMLR